MKSSTPWGFLADYLTSTQLIMCYAHIYVLWCCYWCNYRYVDGDGNNYNPARQIVGPYGSTYVFTGPKVCLYYVDQIAGNKPCLPYICCYRQ